MITLLVVDDEPGICDFIDDFFTRRGHKVVSATDPKKVLGLVEKEKPQVILMDILMPHLSGIDLVKQIRQKSKTTKIVMVTIADTDEMKQKAKAAGADDFIRKPFEVDYLENVVMKKIQELLAA